MKNAAQYKSLGAFGTLGLEIVLSVLLGLWIGTKLDGWLGTSPWMAVLWFGFGCAAAVKAVHRSWRQMQAAAKREEAEEGNPAPQFPDDKTRQWQREEEEAARARAEEAARAREEGDGGGDAAVADGDGRATKERERRDG